MGVADLTSVVREISVGSVRSDSGTGSASWISVAGGSSLVASLGIVGKVLILMSNGSVSSVGTGFM